MRRNQDPIQSALLCDIVMAPKIPREAQFSTVFLPHLSKYTLAIEHKSEFSLLEELVVVPYHSAICTMTPNQFAVAQQRQKSVHSAYTYVTMSHLNLLWSFCFQSAGDIRESWRIPAINTLCPFSKSLNWAFSFLTSNREIKFTLHPAEEAIVTSPLSLGML